MTESLSQTAGGYAVSEIRQSDPGSGRYTLRLQINDSAVELKNRVVHEVVEFYTSDSAVPIELVVASISKNAASGKIAVRQDHPETELHL